MKNIIALLVFIFSGNILFSQSFNLSNPLYPAENRLPEQSIGGYIGVGGNIQSGSHFVDCEGCEFFDGIGTGYSFGLLYERRLMRNIQIGGFLSLDVLDFNSSYTEIEPIEVLSPRTGQNTFVNVPFSHEAQTNLTYLGIAPYIKYTPLELFSMRAAPKLSFPLGSNLRHTKANTDPTPVIDGLEGIADIEPRVIQDSQFPDLNSPQFGIDLTGMFNIYPSDETILSLGYTHYIPFNNVSDFGNDFRVFTWRLFIEFRYTLEENFERP